MSQLSIPPVGTVARTPHGVHACRAGRPVEQYAASRHSAALRIGERGAIVEEGFSCRSASAELENLAPQGATDLNRQVQHEVAFANACAPVRLDRAAWADRSPRC